MAQQDNAARIAEAKKQAKDQPQKAEQTFKSVLEQGPGKSDAAARDYENALMGLGELYRDQRRTNDLAELVQQIKGVLSSLAKAKTAKLGVYPPTVHLFSFHNSNSLVFQCANCSTSSFPSPIRSKHRSPSQSHVSTGPSKNVVVSSARTSRHGWCRCTCKSRAITSPRLTLRLSSYPHQPSAQGVEAS